MNRKEWEEKRTVKLGTLGEEIASKYLKEIGWLSYNAPNKRHPIDWILASEDKKRMCLADIKTKRRRFAKPDTGIEFPHYGEYKLLQQKYNLDVLLVFVDYYLGAIYGNTLRNLDWEPRRKIGNQVYPAEVNESRTKKRQICFPLSHMAIIRELTNEEMKNLNELAKIKVYNPYHEFTKDDFTLSIEDVFKDIY